MQEFQDLFKKYHQQVFGYLLKLTNYNYDLAEELTQETFFQVYLSLPKYKGTSSVFTWICAVGKNVCYKYFKKNPSSLSIDELAFTEKGTLADYSLEDMTEQKELLTYTLLEIMKLNQKYRDVLIYRLFFELSFEEISKLVHITENSAKVIYHRGKNMVRRNMEGFINE